jgi:hypothetical protein
VTRKVLINQTVKSLEKLPDSKLREVSDYVDFLLKREEEVELRNHLTQAASLSKSFSFLEDEDELYSESDLKIIYK